MKALLTIALALVSVTGVKADTAILPDKPVPVVKVKTVDKEFLIDVAAVATAWTMDTISTHQAIVTSSTSHEVGGLFDSSHSTPTIMGAWAAVDAGIMIGSYEWKRHVHNKYLHPLWRAGAIFTVQMHERAAIGNWQAISAYKNGGK